jgi:serralysin
LPTLTKALRKLGEFGRVIDAARLNNQQCQPEEKIMAIINGNFLPNTLIGTPFADIIRGFGSGDRLFGLGGNDLLFGGLGNDALYGGFGNDYLNGESGADLMRGEFGNDTYIVDNVGDNVIELAGQGIDTILSSISTSLSVGGKLNVENLTLTGLGAIVGIGNALNNSITGNNANNGISGLGGNDSLSGLGGNDIMLGGAGNDFLNGGLGSDTMRGQTGNDSYVINAPGDAVIELAGQGIDTIISSISTSLSLAGRLAVENLSLTGTAVVGIGNALNNTIFGDAMNNNLIGLGGNDRLFGGVGADVLQGGVGSDFHNGGAGVDQIITGSGFDTILFNAPLGIANFDRVLDFAPVFDTMQLENSVFIGLTQGAFLPANDFHIGAAAADASDRIIYNSATGNLFFDVDGTGGIGQVLFADLAGGLALTASDFFVV